jgi:hypothetical protein
MKIEKGRNRIVLVFDNFVVKLPRIRLLKAIQRIYRATKGGYLLKCLGWNSTISMSPRHFLLRGIMDNCGEFIFYLATKSNSVMPTYFSLFGLLNIQKSGNILILHSEKEYVNFFGQLYDITNGEVFKDAHTFSNPKNFCREDEKLKMVDYGNAKVRNILLKYGNKIFKQFDFTGLTSR